MTTASRARLNLPAKTEDSGFDWPLLVLWSMLAGLGLLMILSASSMQADAKYGDSMRFVVRQVAGLGLGVVFTGVLLATPRAWIRRLVWPSFLLAFGGLLMVLTPLAHTANGATRWFRAGPINVQPSEFMKIAFVLALAHYLSINEGKLRDPAIVLTSGLLLLVTVIGILPQKDFGTTVILFGLAGILLFVAGLRWVHLAGFVGVVGAALGLLIAVEPYRMKRLVSFTDPFQDQEGAGYQVVQGWIALATGGTFGQGLASGVAQRGFLPEAHTDFISAVVGEELGAIGWVLMVACFAGVVWRALAIASRSRDLFGMLVCVGLAALIGAQTIINLSVVGGLMPNKGLVLPFMSYGASAALAHTMVIGLLLRFSLDD